MAAAFAVTQMAVFSTTIYLHRTATHRALVLHPGLAWTFRLIVWITTGIVTKEWVAVHRKHHAFTDQEGDPHSPLLEGFWAVQLGNVFLYMREIKTTDVVERYARDIEEGWWDRHIFVHGLAGLSLGIAFLCVVLGVGWGLLAAAVHAVSYVFVLSSSINGLCHHVGYKNFDNTATNIRFIALLTGGEGLHNNHHGYPRSPKFSLRWSEIDPAWPLIKLLIALGLARPRGVGVAGRRGCASLSTAQLPGLLAAVAGGLEKASSAVLGVPSSGAVQRVRAPWPRPLTRRTPGRSDPLRAAPSAVKFPATGFGEGPRRQLRRAHLVVVVAAAAARRRQPLNPRRATTRMAPKPPSANPPRRQARQHQEPESRSPAASAGRHWSGRSSSRTSVSVRTKRRRRMMAVVGFPQIETEPAPRPRRRQCLSASRTKNL